MGTTSAPAKRNPPMNSGKGSQASAAPCSWMATRSPDTPTSSRYSSTSCEDSDSGDHSSCKPAARSAPVAFGPRDTIRADDNAVMSWLASPHPSAAEADAGVRDQNVGRIGDQCLCVALQFVIVGQRDHVDRGGAADLGALSA